MIHAIWSGLSPMLPLHEKCIKSWGESHVWNDDELAAEFPDAPIHPTHPHKGLVGDVFRYLILERFGGVYLDVDVELVGPLPALSDAVFREGRHLSVSVLFASAKAPWIQHIVGGMRACADALQPKSAGPHVFERELAGCKQPPPLLDSHPFAIHHMTKSWS